MNFLASNLVFIAAATTACSMLPLTICGCGRAPRPSPYEIARAKKNPVKIKLPEIQATSVDLVASSVQLPDGIKPGALVDISVTLTSADEACIPPFVHVNWYAAAAGTDNRRPRQRGAAIVHRNGTTGTAKVETSAPRKPGKYNLEVSYPFNDTPRQVEFPITVSP